MTFKDLPDEVWGLVASMLVEGDGRQHWQLMPGEAFHPLRAMAQTCKRFEAIACPLLWGHISLDAEDCSERIILLKQLCIALDPPAPAVLYIKSLDIDFRQTEYYARYLACYDMKNEFREIAECNIGTKHIADLDAFNAILEDLGRKLRSCLKLTHFGWRGGYRPTAAMYKDLSKIPNLTSLTLDLGYEWLPCVHRDPGIEGYPDCDDPLDAFSDCIAQAALGLGGYNFAMHGRADAYEDGSYKDIQKRAYDEESRCEGLVKWLSGPNRLRHLVLGAPVLYHQPWLVPLWAQVHNIRDAKERDFGEQLEDVDRPLGKAAQSFRSVLLEHQAAEARNVYDLIHKQAVLQPWRKWFMKWDDTETKNTMAKVAEWVQKSP